MSWVDATVFWKIDRDFNKKELVLSEVVWTISGT
jgi:hypothetical protein